MKLVIQIPCFNEAGSLETTISALPKAIAGIDAIEVLIIDDGSSDGTGELARALGVQHVIRHRRNRGLAAAFRSGLNAALDLGADIIVNTDADNQYNADDIAALVQPIIDGRADIVIGDRGVGSNAHFGWFKRQLQRLGSTMVRKLSRVDISDAVSGFRAISRAAAKRLPITADFSYTTEMLILAGRKRLAIVSVPVRTNGPMRPSRLFNSIPQFIVSTGTTMLRTYAMYNPLRIFVLLGGLVAIVGTLPILRFAYFYAIGEGNGHIQSLVVGAGLLSLGSVAVMLGMVADLIGANRKLLEFTLEHLHAIEARIDALSARTGEHPSVDGDDDFPQG